MGAIRTDRGYWRLATLTMQTKTIALPRLNRLRPSLESTALKLMEEAGELGAAIGKWRGMSGEAVKLEAHVAARHIAQELLDVAQTAITMMFVLEEQHGIDLQGVLSDHVQKLIAKGYLSHDPDQGEEADS